MMARRSKLLAYFALAVFVPLCCHQLLAFVSSATSTRPSISTRTPSNSLRGEVVGLKATAALEAEAVEDDSIEVGGFSGFIVGVALLPYVLNCFYIDFTVIMGGDFAVGPFGLSLTSCLVTLGLVFWSVGSFVQRGRGLPAGPFGLLGLSEGLSYIAVLGLAIAGVTSTVRSSSGTSSKPLSSTLAVPTIKAPQLQAPDIKVPDFKAPDIKVPDFKAPDIKVPDFKALDVKVPDFKAPDVKIPEFKALDMKVPEFKAPNIKVPEVKVPEVKVPEVKLPTPAKAPEVKQPETKKAEPAKAPEPAKKAETSKADYDDLFD